ncbi:MAG: chalcone isomerase family protein [Gammaproteobacteria bacterium]|nr:chalcone isomerase family protein [Gammaproteobacteria bacterium]
MVMLLALPVQIQAKEIAGVSFDQMISVPGMEKALKLNGLGIRYKVFFKIYIAALYVEEPTNQADMLVKSTGGKRVLMHFLYDEVAKEKLVNAWIDGFESNLSADAFSALKPRIDQFNDMFETLAEGDIVLLDYVPGKGTRVTVKGVVKGVVEGADFNRALLNIWLGKEPVTEDLKAALLGA